MFNPVGSLASSIGVHSSRGLGIGVRILCSKIRELCYALMLTIYANYAPQISHYAPEICHYASKQNYFSRLVNRYTQYALWLSTGPARTLGGIFPRVFNVFSIARVVNLVPEAKATSTTIGLGLSTHIETAHAQYAQG